MRCPGLRQLFAQLRCPLLSTAVSLKAQLPSTPSSALEDTPPERAAAAAQVPNDGTISFRILPSGIVIGSAPVTPDPSLGSAYVTIVEPGPGSVGYGSYTGAAPGLPSAVLVAFMAIR